MCRVRWVSENCLGSPEHGMSLLRIQCRATQVRRRRPNVVAVSPLLMGNWFQLVCVIGPLASHICSERMRGLRNPSGTSGSPAATQSLNAAISVQNHEPLTFVVSRRRHCRFGIGSDA